MSSMTGLFKQAFGLNELLQGLAFLSNDLGTIFGSTILIKLINKSRVEMERKYKGI